MRAVVLNEFGPPENLIATDVPEPVAEPGEVIVDVRIASITFVETQVRAGRPPNPAMAPRLPAVLGNGVGGVVAAVGPSGDPSLVGRRVITTTGGLGGYAEQVAVDATGLIEVPEPVELADAVALLADGRTSVALIRAAEVQPGDVCLVEAAAGGLGSLLVQLVRDAGGRVVAAVGGDRKVAVAERLGADVVVDYRRPDWLDRVRDAVDAVDVVFDGVGGGIGHAASDLVRDGGRFLRYGMASGAFTELADEVTEKRGITVVRGAPVTPEAMRELSQTALTLAATGRLAPLIGQTFPLEHAGDAHAAIEDRTSVGKTLLLVAA